MGDDLQGSIERVVCVGGGDILKLLSEELLVPPLRLTSYAWV